MVMRISSGLLRSVRKRLRLKSDLVEDDGSPMPLAGGGLRRSNLTYLKPRCTRPRYLKKSCPSGFFQNSAGKSIRSNYLIAFFPS